MFVRIVWSAIRAEAKVRGSLDEVPARLAKMKTPPRLKLRTDPRRPIKKQAGQRHPVRVVGDRRPPLRSISATNLSLALTRDPMRNTHSPLI